MACTRTNPKSHRSRRSLTTKTERRRLKRLLGSLLNCTKDAKAKRLVSLSSMAVCESTVANSVNRGRWGDGGPPQWSTFKKPFASLKGRIMESSLTSIERFYESIRHPETSSIEAQTDDHSRLRYS